MADNLIARAAGAKTKLRRYTACLMLPAAMLTPAMARAQQQVAAADEIPTIVIHATPLPSLPIDPKTVAAPIQTLTSQDLERSQSNNLTDYLNRNLNAVYVNETQSNPFQPDINYRGFTASPLLGTPEGMSVYMDGVRVNQPFGDVVSWDLIPRYAISSVELIPGSNPLFGLNTLGGALAIVTKNGRDNPGTSAQAEFGSFDRKSIDVAHGGSSGNFDWFVAGTGFKEDGWRMFSNSNVEQAFGKVGWEDGGTKVHLTSSYVASDLTGDGLQEFRLLQNNYASVYTPDVTHNRASFVNAEAQHAVSDTFLISANAYYRHIHTRTFNDDVNDDSLDQSLYQPSAAERTILAAKGYTNVPTSGANAANTPFPSLRCIANALLLDEPGEKCDGIINHTGASENNYGVSAQASLSGDIAGMKNTFIAGAGYDGSDVHFTQLSELGYLTPDHRVTGVGAFGDGVRGGNIDGVPFDTQVNLQGSQDTYSVFATDTLGLVNDTLNLTISGRYNRTDVHNHDLIRASGSGSLTGNDVYSRFNPAAGITYSPVPDLTAYAGYNQGSRAPSAIELGCADSANPCKLPNAFAGDPPLKQVVARTLEAGLRGTVSQMVTLSWSAGVFRTTASNDISFVADNAAGFGYFKNFGKTRRQGIELSADGSWQKLSFGANYTFLDATYRSPETIDGTGNSSSDAGNGLEGIINIVPGDKIPLAPRHAFKFHADYAPIQGLLVGVETLTQSSMYARGNENNLHQPDGVYYLGPGKSPGYTVVALRAQYDVTPWAQLFFRIDNLFDAHYATSALLASTAFNATGTAILTRQFPAVGGDFPVQQSTFFAPGAPRSVAGGIRVKL